MKTLFTFLLSFILISIHAQTTTHYFLGTEDLNWENPLNWDVYPGTTIDEDELVYVATICHINAGTTISNFGEFYCWGGQLTINGGEFINSGFFFNIGNFQINDGYIHNLGDMENFMAIEMNNTSFVNDGNFQEHGFFNITGGSIVNTGLHYNTNTFNSLNTDINNSGIIHNYSYPESVHKSNFSIEGGNFVNSNYIHNESESEINPTNVNFNNIGEILNDHGSISLMYGVFNNTGEVLNFNQSSFGTYGGTDNNSNFIHNDNFSNFSIGSLSFNNSGNVLNENESTFMLWPCALENSGSIVINSNSLAWGWLADINNSGELLIDELSYYEMHDENLNNSGVIINDGNFYHSGTLNNSGSFNSNNFQFHYGTFYNSGYFTNNNFFCINEIGIFTNCGVWTGGEQCGEGTINPGGDVNNNGIDDSCEPCDLEVDAGDCEVAYYGYDPYSCVDLFATVSNGTLPYSYSWILDGEIVGETESIPFCPEYPTDYEFTIEVIDAIGCFATNFVTVEVVDVRCGLDNNKVLLCQNPNNPHTICVAPLAVPAHLALGAILGECGILPCNGEQESIVIKPCDEIEIQKYNFELLTVFPNPSDDVINIELKDASIKNILLQSINENKIHEYDNSSDGQLNISNLNSGVYILKVITEMDEVLTKKIIKLD